MHARPDASGPVRAALARMPGVELSYAGDAGRFVVVAEHDGPAEAADSYVAIRAIEGVVSVSLVYQYADDSPISEEV